MAASGLSCGMWDLLCGMRDLLLRCVGSFVAVCGLFVAARGLLSSCGMRSPECMDSVVAAHGLSSCDAQAQ